MVRHSKNVGDKHHFGHFEKGKTDTGTITARLGTDSQLPFGYCCLSLNPVEDPVISPSGHIYSREAILEYLLLKTQELKKQAKLYENQELLKEDKKITIELEQREIERIRFTNGQEGIDNIVKRKATESEKSSSYLVKRSKIIDEQDKKEQQEELKKVSPWLVEYTPTADIVIKEAPKRPASPFSGRGLRAKDLIPIHLDKEVESSKSTAGSVRYVCSVTKKTITNQKCIVLKNTGVVMLESAAKELALPSMICPITSKKFKSSDVIDLVAAASSFSASGPVEAKHYRPALN